MADRLVWMEICAACASVCVSRSANRQCFASGGNPCMAGLGKTNSVLSCGSTSGRCGKYSFWHQPLDAQLWMDCSDPVQLPRRRLPCARPAHPHDTRVSIRLHRGRCRTLQPDLVLDSHGCLGLDASSHAPLAGSGRCSSCPFRALSVPRRPLPHLGVHHCANISNAFV